MALPQWPFSHVETSLGLILNWGGEQPLAGEQPGGERNNY